MRSAVQSLPADLHRNARLETVYCRPAYFLPLADPCAELPAQDLRIVGSETHVGRSGREAGRDDSGVGSVIGGRCCRHCLGYRPVFVSGPEGFALPLRCGRSLKCLWAAAGYWLTVWRKGDERINGLA